MKEKTESNEKSILPEKIADLLENQEKTTKAILAMAKEQLGNVPFIMKTMSKRPEAFIPGAISDYFKTRPSSLSEKNAELIALSAAAANKCPDCINVHVEAAKKCGATDDEILDVILISGVMSEAAVLARALRAYEDKISKEGKE